MATSRLRWIPEFLVQCSGVALFYLIHTNVLSVSKATGPSMKPTIDHNILLVDRLSFKLLGLKKGDVVCAVAPIDRETEVCKRIKGLPGDTVQMDDGNSVVLPANHFWLEGDNQRESFDSRSYGPVSLALITGKVVLSLSPFGPLNSK